MAERAISAVPVVDDAGGPVGVVSEADLIPKAQYQGQHELSRFAGPRRQREWQKAQAMTAEELMSRNLKVINADAKIAEAARELAHAGVRRLLVVDGDGRLVGVLARRDLLKAYLRNDQQILADVRKEVLDTALWPSATEVDVSVENGVVTLAGTVERRSEAQIAVRLTQALPAVMAVNDRLRYTWDDTGADRGTSNVLS